MFFLRRLLERLSGRADRDLDRELRAHLELETEEQQEAGLPREQARYAAQRAFGNLALVKEDARAMWDGSRSNGSDRICATHCAPCAGARVSRWSQCSPWR